jgi:hypothetical protein
MVMSMMSVDFTPEFQEFLNVDLTLALGRLENDEPVCFVYTQSGTMHEPVRRVLVIREAGATDYLTVSIEAAYELFEGDYHHIVRRIGTYRRGEPVAHLREIVEQAYETVMLWKPTLANIQDTAFLRN